MLPYHDIAETQDRSWTSALLGRLDDPGLGADELGALVEALAALADPRAEPALLARVEDPAQPQRLREAAASALADAAFQPDPPRLRRWWAEGDDWLRTRALREMGGAEADLLLPVAEDPAHPLHAVAIGAMMWGFEHPRHQRIKTDALSHPDPAVRREAADALLWDEPVIAEEPLLQAAADPVPEVALAAIETLMYYPSRRCLLALDALKGRVEGPVLERLTETLGQLKAELVGERTRSSGPARARLVAWMAPVAHLLPTCEEDEEDEEAPPPPVAPPRAAAPERAWTAAELVATYTPRDGPWKGRAERFPRQMPPAELALATPFLLAHPDPRVREWSCRLFESGDAHAALWTLAHDPVFLVRKSAVYHLGCCSPRPDLAAGLWSKLEDAATQGMHAMETLSAWAAHAPRALALARLPAVARDDDREGVRCRAVHELTKLEARAEIASLLPLLAEPPRVSWGVHLHLLWSCKKLMLHADISPMESVDNLHVQVALADRSI